jgi:hypothetical protein
VVEVMAVIRAKAIIYTPLYALDRLCFIQW